MFGNLLNKRFKKIVELNKARNEIYEIFAFFFSIFNVIFNFSLLYFLFLFLDNIFEIFPFYYK